MNRGALEQLLLIVMSTSLCLKCVKLRHNIPTLSRVNPILRGHNTQVTGSHLVWILDYVTIPSVY